MKASLVSNKTSIATPHHVPYLTLGSYFSTTQHSNEFHPKYKYCVTPT